MPSRQVPPAGIPNPRGRATSALGRLLHLVGDLVTGGVYRALQGLLGPGDGLVERLLDSGFSDNYHAVLVSRELQGCFVEFLTFQCAGAERLRDDTHARTVDPLRDVRFAILLIDDSC